MSEVEYRLEARYLGDREWGPEEGWDNTFVTDDKFPTREAAEAKIADEKEIDVKFKNTGFEYRILEVVNPPKVNVEQVDEPEEGWNPLETPLEIFNAEELVAKISDGKVTLYQGGHPRMVVPEFIFDEIGWRMSRQKVGEIIARHEKKMEEAVDGEA